MLSGGQRIHVLVFSARPEEYQAREAGRHDAKNEVLGHSKQAEFVRLMEQEVKQARRREISEDEPESFCLGAPRL